MMKFVLPSAALFAVALGHDSAFVPSAPVLSRSRDAAVTPLRAAEGMLGSDVETGGVFDPLGFAKDEASLYKYRTIELKHGRLAMLACLGYFVQTAGLHWPDPVFSERAPLAELQKLATERPAALAQIVAALAAIEVTIGKQDPDKAPGELGLGARFIPEDQADFEALQLKELKNGRLAMFSIAGMILQEAAFGTDLYLNPYSGGDE
uniref:Uncharacterized protein n=1 Tax=Chromera velia CCMP2878 TaxID=1169474 RepID=A0A0G4HJ46_9ALVE|mmetsp:Transcript_50555/g.99464  ORF Transcript_50555/g.99464 Transcript_50555/m.99464 type:complete len:207 (+) Transcript_50555:143-763(+)|eukprot:Cvel_7036.t1-p1 / transcript=Cvel_7036.t1 / gene=Cvel_7036 / organism=Chromera_velia_CCMP2878 / gene_product=Fucoxanthin-chlorophyll a-c binding protein C,, putative / transcript_product=Fucoxanthin-chlorophyll a-c binding protein C,, putative / location=Cvel_scaffold359:34267-36418(+) / protein_length=206 / sequence_SO=supercontig / SO=protein_coding / is_pseudo=false